MYLFAILGLWFAMAETPPAFRREDCRIFAHAQRYTRDVYGSWSWGTYDVVLSGTMELQGERDFTFVKENVVASLMVNEKDARLRLTAPGLQRTRVLPVAFDRSVVGRLDFSAEQHDEDTGTGRLYSVHCTLGLNALVEAQKAADEAEMDRLGPSREWPDQQAPSLEQLAVGTVLELTRDIDVRPGTNRAETTLVEANGLMTHAAFWELRLPFRFAFAEFFNANNGYIRDTHYPRGMRLRIEQIQRRDFSSGGHEYVMKFTTEGAVEDPIVWMKVTGRRAGATDVVVPQFAQLLAPAFRIVGATDARSGR